SHALTGAVLRGTLLNMTYEQVWQQDLPQDAFFMIENNTMTRVDCLVELSAA
ncbi:phosphoglycerate mutase, partial [Vibrio xuii]